MSGCIVVVGDGGGGQGLVLYNIRLFLLLLPMQQTHMYTHTHMHTNSYLSVGARSSVHGQVEGRGGTEEESEGGQAHHLCLYAGQVDLKNFLVVPVERVGVGVRE